MTICSAASRSCARFSPMAGGESEQRADMDGFVAKLLNDLRRIAG